MSRMQTDEVAKRHRFKHKMAQEEVQTTEEEATCMFFHCKIRMSKKHIKNTDQKILTQQLTPYWNLSRDMSLFRCRHFKKLTSTPLRPSRCQKETCSNKMVRKPEVHCVSQELSCWLNTRVLLQKEMQQHKCCQSAVYFEERMEVRERNIAEELEPQRNPNHVSKDLACWKSSSHTRGCRKRSVCRGAKLSNILDVIMAILVVIFHVGVNHLPTVGHCTTMLHMTR